MKHSSWPRRPAPVLVFEQDYGSLISCCMNDHAPRVGIIMGSDSDLPVMQEAAQVLDELQVSYELTVVSAHRTPDRLATYAREAHQRGLAVIIAGAGGAAHLPGMVAAWSPLPVIGVPVKSKALNGMDSLLSIAQMPPGVPVATVAINGAKNAGILAAQILGSSDTSLQAQVVAYKHELQTMVEEKALRLEQQGFADYLAQTKEP